MASPKMSLEEYAQTSSFARRPCWICESSLCGEIDAAVAKKTAGATVIARWLKAQGHEVSVAQVRRHIEREHSR